MVVASFLAVATGQAQNFIFQNGDVVLGFQATAGQGNTQNLFFNLGSTTSLRDNPARGVVVNLNSELSAVFGSDWFNRDDVFFGVYGNLNSDPTTGFAVPAPVNGDPTRTTYVSAPAASPRGSISWVVNSAGLGTAGTIFSGMELILPTLAASTSNTTILDQVNNPVEWNNSWSVRNPVPGASFSIFSGGIQNGFGKAAGIQEVYVDIQRILATSNGANPGGTVGRGDYLTTLGISSTGDVRLFVASGDPTPTPTPTPNPTATPTPEPTATPTPDPTATPTPEPTATPTPDPTATPTPEPTATPTPDPTATPTPSPTATPTPSPTPTLFDTAALIGSYQGVVGDLGSLEPSTNAASIVAGIDAVNGGVTLRVLPNRTFTLSVILNGQKYAGRGVINPNGQFSGSVSGKGGTLDLEIEYIAPDANTAYFRGTLGSEQVLLGKAIYGKSNPFPASTLVGPMPLGTPRPETPQGLRGAGTATMTVNSAGVGRLAGFLPDGTRYTATIPVWGATGDPSENVVLVHMGLYRGQGLIGGWLVEGLSAETDLGGVLNWSSPASGGRSPRFTAPFEAILLPDLALSPRLARGESLVSWTSGNLTFQFGQLTTPVTGVVTLGANNKISFSGGALADRKVKITVNPTTALVTGSFVHPVTGRPVKFNAALNRKSENAQGFFLSPLASGLIELEGN